MNKTKTHGIIVSFEIALIIFLVIAILSPQPTITGFAEVVYRIYAPSNETMQEIKGVNITANEPPIFLAYYPTNLRQILYPDENLNFFIRYADPNQDYVFPRWYKNNALVSSEDYYIFVPASLGKYNITVILSDMSLASSVTWIINVIEKAGKKCTDIICPDSVITCPDGLESRCKNFCDKITGECPSCTPLCFIYPSSDYSPPSEKEAGQEAAKGAEITRRTVPCVVINQTEQKTLDIDEEELTKFINMPNNYSVVLEPFSLNCKGLLDLTVSIPNNYIDVEALRCKGVECKPATIEKISNLKCGSEISKELFRKTDYLEPRAMPIKIQEVSLNLTSFNQYLLNQQNYQIRFHGSIFGNLTAVLSMPSKPVEEAKNPTLKIVGTPMVLNLGNYKGALGSTVKMPYLDDTGFEKDSIAMYIKTKEGWDYIGGVIDNEKKIVTAEVDEIGNYLNENYEAIFALMGVICEYCLNSSMKKIYEPLKPARNAVVLIHGLASSPATYQEMIDDIRLTQQSFQLWTFGYPSERSIRENAKDLMKHLEANSKEYDNLFIVAHSLGGIIAQQALYMTYKENQENPSVYYSYLSKVKKVLLVGTPNEGSPVIDVYQNLLKSLANIKSSYKAFNPSGVAARELIKGVITPRVPGIKYYVIAGTNPMEFNILFFKLTTKDIFAGYEKNDGITTTKGAQHTGDSYINDLCENYWEVNVTHTELIDHPLARQLIEKVVSEELLKQKEQISLLGANKYFEIKLTDCSQEDKFIIIGKKIKPEEVYDETGCSCGNGACGLGEDEFNCPSDCAVIKKKESIASALPNLIVIMLILLILFINYEYKKLKKLKQNSLIRLSEYMHSNFDIVAKEGYTFKQLATELLEKGFPKRIISKSYDSIKKAFFKKYTNMREFIQKNLAKGHTKRYIKEMLVKSGWSEDIIDEAFVEEFIEPRFRRKILTKEEHPSRFFRIEK